MKKTTKDNLVTGGVLLGGIAAIMLITQSGDGEGGFGGGGGIPLLPGDTADAAEGDTVINYILGGGEGTSPFSVFGEDTESKKSAYIAAYEQPESVMQQVIAGQAIYEPTTEPIRFGAADVREDLGIEPKKSAQTPDKPIQWGEASVGGFFDFLAPITQLGEGARGRDISLYSKQPVKKFAGAVTATQQIDIRKVSTVAEAKKVALKKQTSSGRYWRMTGGATHAPGWKQIGAREPTAPGQPDIY